jgi:signal transduction histidine kinase
MIWASSKHMFMLTNSELVHWDIDRKQYSLEPTTFDPANRFETFEEYLRSLLRPYMIKSRIRQITIKFDFSRIFYLTRAQMHTDWKMYEFCLIHLVSNAVKYSPTDSVIKIEIAMQPIEVEVGSFTC